MMKLIVAFRNFANAPYNQINKISKFITTDGFLTQIQKYVQLLFRKLDVGISKGRLSTLPL